jgi:hypothetical protein
MTPDEVEQTLEENADERFIGKPETEQLDFKEQPYFLSTDKGKWALAKDVAALANSGGGCLVIGVATTVPVDREEEVASEVKAFPSGLADVQQMRGTLDAASGVYPVLKGVKIRKYPRPDGKAMMIVRVPPQAEDDLPFMVVRMVEGDERRGIGIGVPFRSGPHTYWLPPGQLHRDLSDGRRARLVPSALAGEQKPTSLSTPVADRTEERLTSIEQYMGWGEAATLMLAAVPVPPQAVPVDGFYDPTRLRGCVQTPPEIRHAGFSLAWTSDLENVEGSLVNATAERQVLWVDPDGAAFAAAVGLQSFLTRSGGTRYAQQPEPRIINPTVLVEWTYLFFKFVHECVRPSVSGPMRAALRLRGAVSREWPLLMVGGKTVQSWQDGTPAGLDDFYTEFDVGDAPGEDAFHAVSRIYAVFGIGEDRIPYTADNAVDPELIRAIR